MYAPLTHLAFVALTLATLSSCGGQDVPQTNTVTEPADTVVSVPSAPAQTCENVAAEKFKSLIESGNGMLLDVRTPAEYAQGNIAGSTNIDFNDAGFSAAIDSLDKSVPVYVYCQSGGRSGQAMELMKEKGFLEVYNLTGGYGNWPYK